MARSAGVQFEMRQIGNRFYQWSRYETAQGPKQSKTSIDLVLGAGKADDVYLSWREDGGLFELPVAWLWPTREWASSHFCNPFGEGDFSRDMTVRCMECHTTWMEHAPGTNLFRRDEALLGVTCERCHGPGRDHVEYHRLNPGKSAEKILNPISLDRELLIEVCTQCHLLTAIGPERLWPSPIGPIKLPILKMITSLTRSRVSEKAVVFSRMTL
jgi:hypothetical protein